ncbi:MAG: PaaI family thioesterase [Bacteroidota bacterium]|jgi:uncharacterized protein (TIGR00369 family)
MNEELNLMQTLGIKITAVSKQEVTATMMVLQQHLQPFGLLHGGATAALAETVGSIGAYENVKEKGGVPVGIELSVNHLKSVRFGEVTAVGNPIHLGKTTHLWEVNCYTEDKEKFAFAKLTVLIKYEK